MSDFDRSRSAPLSDDDRTYLDNLTDQRGLFEQMGATFHGPLRGWTIYAFVMSFLIFGLSVFAFIKLLSVSTLPALAFWLAVFTWSSVVVGLVKIWFWMRMNHLDTLRELKRIELRLAERG